MGTEIFQEGWEDGGVTEVVDTVAEDDEIVRLMCGGEGREFGGCVVEGYA